MVALSASEMPNSACSSQLDRRCRSSPITMAAAADAVKAVAEHQGTQYGSHWRQRDHRDVAILIWADGGDIVDSKNCSR